MLCGCECVMMLCGCECVMMCECECVMMMCGCECMCEDDVVFPFFAGSGKTALASHLALLGKFPLVKVGNGSVDDLFHFNCHVLVVSQRL